MSTVSGANTVRGASTASGEPTSSSMSVAFENRTADSRGGEIAGYLDAVRTALTDLDTGVRDGLLEDLPEHLSEAAAANFATLEAQLGPPSTFAAELRSAAGLAPVGAVAATEPTDPGISSAELARLFLVRVDRALGRLAGYNTFRELLGALRPAWWVVRGAGVAAFLLIVSGYEYMWYYTASRLLALVLFGLVSGIISVRLGRASQRVDARTRIVIAMVNVPCLLAALYSANAILTRR